MGFHGVAHRLLEEEKQQKDDAYSYNKRSYSTREVSLDVFTNIFPSDFFHTWHF
jgi:hypothetical protein